MPFEDYKLQSLTSLNWSHYVLENDRFLIKVLSSCFHVINPSIRTHRWKLLELFGHIIPTRIPTMYQGRKNDKSIYSNRL